MSQQHFVFSWKCESKTLLSSKYQRPPYGSCLKVRLREGRNGRPKPFHFQGGPHTVASKGESYRLPLPISLPDRNTLCDL